MSCRCGGELEVLSVPYEMWAKCVRCGSVYVFPYGSDEWEFLWLLRESKRLSEEKKLVEKDFEKIVRRYRGLRESVDELGENLRKILFKEIRKGGGDCK